MRICPLARLISFAALLAQAGTIATTNDPTGSRAAFGGDDTIDWDTAGPGFTVLTNPFTIVSTGGLSVTVSEPSGVFERRDQPAGWFGNFTSNTTLLWTEGRNGPITMTFASPIKGIGFQISPDDSDTAAQFEVFGVGDVDFGTFPLTVTDRMTASASFVGVESSLTDIAKIIIDLAPEEDFAINQASLITGEDTPSVPEPSTFGMICVAGIAVLAKRRQ